MDFTWVLKKLFNFMYWNEKKNHLTTPRDRLIVVALPSVLAWKLKDPNKMILQTTTHTKKERDEKVTLMWHVSLHGWSQKSFFITNFCLLTVIITKTVENCNFRWWRKCLHVIWIEYSCRSSSSSGDEKNSLKFHAFKFQQLQKRSRHFCNCVWVWWLWVSEENNNNNSMENIAAADTPQCWRQIYLHIWWSNPNNVNVVCGKTMIIIAFLYFISFIFMHVYICWVQLLHSRTLLNTFDAPALNAYGSWQWCRLLCYAVEISNCPHKRSRRWKESLANKSHTTHIS